MEVRLSEHVEIVESSAPEKPKPKMDLRRVLIDLARRWWMLLIVFAVAGLAAYFGGKRFAKQTYEATTTLVYRLNDEKKDDTDNSKNLLTLKSIVKVRNNLEEARNALHLDNSLAQIGAAIEVDVEKNTNLMTIQATWNTAEGAQNLANAIRDAFLKNQVGIDQIQAKRELDSQKERLAVVQASLAKADMELQTFTNKNHITDFVSMARAYMEGYNSVDILYQTALVEQKTNHEQMKNLDRIVAEQKAKVASEKNQAANTESVTDLATRMERIRSAIHDDQELRARQADLALREIELSRMKGLYDQGAVAKKKLDEAQAAYDKQKALTVDTDQVKQWRAELEKLQQTVIPSSGITASSQLLQEMLSKDFNIQLESVAIDAKVESFKRARDEYERKLAAMPDLQRTSVILNRRSDALETEKKTLDDGIAKANRLLGISTPDFITVGVAKLPPMPKTSNRKTMTIMFGALVTLIGLGVVVGTVIGDSRLKTEGDLAAASSYPVLAELPTFSRKQAVFPPPSDSELAVKMSALTRAVRRQQSIKGARIAVAGIHTGDGASSIAVAIATALARQSEAVVLGALGPNENAVTLAAPDANRTDWVTAIDEQGATLTDFVVPGNRAVPSVLPALPFPVTADSLSSVPMRNSLMLLSKNFDVVVLDLLPVTESLQVELLGSYCDGILLVTRSGHLRRDTVKKLERDFEAAGVPVIGWVLNSVPRIYQEKI